MSKQKVTPTEILHLDGREATTVTGARKLLNQRAKDELGIERDYSRDAVYAMFVAGKIEGVRTPSANYYYIDSLRQVPLDQRQRNKPKKYTHRVGKEGYPQKKKDEAIQLYQEGITRRAIARQLNVSAQTINNWIREQESPQV